MREKIEKVVICWEDGGTTTIDHENETDLVEWCKEIRKAEFVS